ncbi:MAG: helix-turn-helix transcriptional regulator [Rhizomicrobium sp.]
MPRSANRQLDNYIGRRIQARRKAMRITQSQLAKGMNLSFQQIQRYEAGTSTITAPRLYQLARLMEVPIEYFFDAPLLAASLLREVDGKRLPELERTIDFATSPEGTVLIDAFRAIANRDLRRQMLRLIALLGKDLAPK